MVAISVIVLCPHFFQFLSAKLAILYIIFNIKLVNINTNITFKYYILSAKTSPRALTDIVCT